MAFSTKKLVLDGVLWSGFQMVVSQSFSFLIKLILAKILFPDDFGLVGMAIVFTGFIQVVNDLGIGAALIQRKEKSLRSEHFDTAFWTGLIWATILYLIMCLVIGPFASIFYNEPILKELIPVLSLGILASPVNLVHKSQLTRLMNFKKIAIIENISSIFSGLISLLLAFLGAGIWSLIFNSIVVIIAAIPLYFNATGWKPRLIWERKAFKDIFSFGIFTTGTNIINYIFNNVDFLLIGKLLNANILGVYSLAFMLTDTFKNRLSAVMSKVMYPVYANSQDNMASVKKVYIKVVEYNCILVYPFMLYFILMGKSFILFVYGEIWADAILPLQILSGAVMIQILVYSNTVLFRGVGKADFELKLQLVKSLIYVPILLYGIYFYGILGAAWATLINRVIAVVITNYALRAINIKIDISSFIEMITPSILAALTSSVVVFMCKYLFMFHFIFTSIILFCSYFVTVYGMKKNEFSLFLKEYKKNSSV